MRIQIILKYICIQIYNILQYSWILNNFKELYHSKSESLNYSRNLFSFPAFSLLSLVWLHILKHHYGSNIKDPVTKLERLIPPTSEKCFTEPISISHHTPSILLSAHSLHPSNMGIQIHPTLIRTRRSTTIKWCLFLFF